MCLLNVKEEQDFSVPARYKKVTRVRRYSPPPSPPRSIRYSRSAYIEERRPPHHSLPPPSKPTTVVEPPPPPPPSLPPAPSVHSPTNVESIRSRRTSRAPSVRTTARSHYVEVEPEPDDDSSSASSSSEDVRSRTTSHTRKSSHSKAPTAVTSARSEYSVHEREREFRRERGYSRPRDEYETYRYVNAPPDARRSTSRAGTHDPRSGRETRVVIQDGRPADPRASRETRVVIEDGRIRNEYR